MEKEKSQVIWYRILSKLLDYSTDSCPIMSEFKAGPKDMQECPSLLLAPPSSVSSGQEIFVQN